MNVECTQEVLDELTSNFRYNDAVLRNMVIRRDEAVTDMSPIKAAESREDRRRAERAERAEAESASESADDQKEESAEAPAEDNAE